jgi:hypothetical protein
MNERKILVLPSRGQDKSAEWWRTVAQITRHGCHTVRTTGQAAAIVVNKQEPVIATYILVAQPMT